MAWEGPLALKGGPGPPGLDGQDGQDGMPGPHGVRGLAGERGSPGMDGRDGEDGGMLWPPGFSGSLPIAKMPLLNGFADATPADADRMAFYDASTGLNSDCSMAELRTYVHTGTNVSVYLSADSAAWTQNAWNTINFNTETTDALGEYDTTAFTFTPATTGDYLIDLGVTISGITVDRVICSVWIGTTSEHLRTSDGTITLAGAVRLARLTATTAYKFRAYPLSAGNFALGGAAFTFLTIRRLYP